MGVDINWGLLRPGEATNNALAQGMQLGQQFRQAQDRREQKNALMAYAGNPSQQTLAPVMANDPRLGMQLQDQQRQQAEADHKRQADQLIMVGRLAKAVKSGQLDYAQALQIGQRQGVDVSQAPATPDPKWLDEHIAVGGLYEKDGGETISGIARELHDAGFDLKTPEGQAAMRGVIQNKYAADYVDDAGNTRRRSALQLPGAPGAAAGITEGATATNPQTGEKIMYRGGQWVPMGQGGGGGRVTSNFLDGL